MRGERGASCGFRELDFIDNFYIGKMIKNFEKLEIWQRGRVLVKTIYLLTKELPNDERFGLAIQLKRAAVSVPSNISEGCGRNHVKELIQSLYISIGSLCELETQLFLIMDLELVSPNEALKIKEEVVILRKMILSYIKTLR